MSNGFMAYAAYAICSKTGEAITGNWWRLKRRDFFRDAEYEKLATRHGMRRKGVLILSSHCTPQRATPPLDPVS